jgi:hypothetical protein
MSTKQARTTDKQDVLFPVRIQCADEPLPRNLIDGFIDPYLLESFEVHIGRTEQEEGQYLEEPCSPRRPAMIDGLGSFEASARLSVKVQVPLLAYHAKGNECVSQTR